MSTCLIYVNPANHKTPDDVDLGSRIEIALTNQKRFGWHEIYIAVRSGQVTLSGVVASERERKFVTSVTSRVAGVFRIKDELKVDESYCQKDANGGTDELSEFETYAAQQKTAKRLEELQRLPEVSVSLEDILASRSKESSF